MHSCNHLADLVLQEKQWISNSPEFKAYKAFLERVLQDDLPEKEAMNDYMRSDLFPYHAERMREFYCNNICSDRYDCSVCNLYTDYFEKKE